MADQKIKVEITGFTYTEENHIYAIVNTQNVKVTGEFWWEALNEF